MSILLGACSLTESPLPDRLTATLEALLPRSEWRRQTWLSERTAIMQCGLSLLGQREWHETTDFVVAVAGQLLAETVRGEEVDSLAAAAERECLDSLLRQSNGTFVALAYDKRHSRLQLATDAIGGRPLYYTQWAGCLLFSTSSTLLRRIPGIELRPDLAAFAEQQILAYPLGERTLWHGLRVLRENSVLSVTGSNVTVRQYFDWQSMGVIAQNDTQELARDAAACFRAAVSDRMRSDDSDEVALLSGGLDSRLIVAELRAQARPVTALSLHRPGMQDTVYAERFAAHVGARLTPVPWSPQLGGVSPGDTTARMLAFAVASLGRGAVWSGDGGGETLGLLLLSEATWQLAEAGEVARAVDHHVKGYAPSKHLLSPSARSLMAGAPQRRLLEEIELLRAIPRGKALQLSMLRNDMRCHLHDYFDRIGDTRVELRLPFYDRRIIECAIKLPEPLGPSLHHRFYQQVLQHAPPSVLEVPWQSYPGRPTSPVPPDPDIPTQWNGEPREFGDTLARVVARRLRAGRLSSAVKRRVVLSALLLHGLKLREMASVFAQAIALSELEEPVVPERFLR
jgi:asparagine synthase (glutamine-hydrolysing)